MSEGKKSIKFPYSKHKMILNFYVKCTLEPYYRFFFQMHPIYLHTEREGSFLEYAKGSIALFVPLRKIVYLI